MAVRSGRKAFPIDERHTDIVVDFFVPGVDPDRVERLRKFYTDLYARLYGEDLWMMTVRQERLDALNHEPAGPVADTRQLGPLEELRTHFQLVVEIGSRSFRLVELDGELIAYSTVCPHMLGPLEYGTLEQ